MTVDKLSPVMRQAYDALTTEEQRADFLDELNQARESTIRYAMAGVMARNMSHSVGKHALKLWK